MTRSDHGLDTPRGTHWSQRALCKQLVDVGRAHPEDWQPASTGNRMTDSRIARRLCNGCSVWRDCLEDALANGEDEGVWGGFTPRERRAVGKRRAAA